MNQQSFVTTAWYATGSRAMSRSKFQYYDDSGQLKVEAGRLRFAGKKTTLDLGEIVDVHLARQRLRRLDLAAIAVLLLLLVSALYGTFFIPAAHGSPFIFVFLLSCLAAVTSLPWVAVRYRDASGTLQDAYFADISAFGFGGLRGSKRIYDALRSVDNRAAANHVTA